MKFESISAQRSPCNTSRLILSLMFAWKYVSLIKITVLGELILGFIWSKNLLNFFNESKGSANVPLCCRTSVMNFYHICWELAKGNKNERLKCGLHFVLVQ